MPPIDQWVVFEPLAGSPVAIAALLLAALYLRGAHERVEGELVAEGGGDGPLAAAPCLLRPHEGLKVVACADVGSRELEQNPGLDSRRQAREYRQIHVQVCCVSKVSPLKTCSMRDGHGPLNGLQLLTLCAV